MCNGTITRAFTVDSSAESPRHNIMVHFDDGNSGEFSLPNKDIHLLPMKNGLNENEIMLCHELLNFSQDLKKSAREISKSASGEESPSGDGGDDSEGKDAKAHAEECRSSPATSTDCGPALFCGPAPAPYYAQPGAQLGPWQLLEQQLVSAARLLTSVNPSLAIAALASARQFNLGVPPQNVRKENKRWICDLGVPRQSQVPMVFPQRYPIPMHFAYPPPMAPGMVPRNPASNREDNSAASRPNEHNSKG